VQCQTLPGLDDPLVARSVSSFLLRDFFFAFLKSPPLKLEFEIAESTVSKYMMWRRGPPSQTWRTFLRNHADAIVAIDLCVVPTLTFESLFAFLVVGHGRRQLLWFAVTRHPTAEWLAQQIVQAFPWNTAPTYLVRDNDGAYGQAFTSRVDSLR
jgi:hypothetical protein